MSQRIPNESATIPQASRRLDAALAVERGDRNREAATLLRQWMSETDGYDREMWPLVKDELKDLRTRIRE